jgi:hypothetical protein
MERGNRLVLPFDHLIFTFTLEWKFISDLSAKEAVSGDRYSRKMYHRADKRLSQHRKLFLPFQLSNRCDKYALLLADSYCSSSTGSLCQL